MDLDESMLPTNHERRSKKEDEGTSPRLGDIEMQDSAGDPDLDELDKDIGEPYLSCRSRVEPQKPDVQTHLLSIYGLGSLQRSVARQDPFTQEKINKLRKSYEGQIKDFQLAGRNKAVKLKQEKPNEPSMRASIGSFTSETRGTYLQNTEEWEAANPKREIKVTDDFRSKLRKAMQMQPGRVRNEAKWDDVLGHEKKTAAPLAMASAQAAAQRPNGLMRPAPQSAAELKRQTRGKKRSYGDDSFIGYGEGYSEPEDASPDGEYGSDDGNRKKRRKNESFNAQLLGR